MQTNLSIHFPMIKGKEKAFVKRSISFSISHIGSQTNSNQTNKLSNIKKSNPHKTRVSSKDILNHPHDIEIS